MNYFTTLPQLYLMIWRQWFIFFFFFFPSLINGLKCIGICGAFFMGERKIYDNNGDDDESDFQDFLNTDHLATGPLTVCLALM